MTVCNCTLGGTKACETCPNSGIAWPSVMPIYSHPVADELRRLREENEALRALFAKYRDAIADIHRKDWSEDVADYRRHTEEDDCWLCDLIVPVDAALNRLKGNES